MRVFFLDNQISVGYSFLVSKYLIYNNIQRKSFQIIKSLKIFKKKKIKIKFLRREKGIYKVGIFIFMVEPLPHKLMVEQLLRLLSTLFIPIL